MSSRFSQTRRIFENARRLRLTRHELELAPATRLMRTSSRLFQLLDRADPVQAEVSRRLWVLRSSTLFTMLPFDSPGLQLHQQVRELALASERLPDTAALIDTLAQDIEALVNTGRNPKRDWLCKAVDEGGFGDSDTIGILSALSSGRPPGWPPESAEQLPLRDGRIVLIHSRRQLRDMLFGTLVLPCGCGNAPPELLSELLFAGRVVGIEVLLYQGEVFRAPKRIRLSADSVFWARLVASEIEQDLIEALGDPAGNDIDTNSNEWFWDGLHGAGRSKAHGLVEANYLLFGDSSGVFLPAGGSVVALPVSGALRDERDLRTIPVGEIAEGDLLVLRSGASGLLLDKTSERIMDRAGKDDLLELATDWKVALEALLVTRSADEIAQALRERGATVHAGSIRQWTGPEVLGPGSEEVFRALVSLLAETGKIGKTGAELADYTDSRWRNLRELRGVRQSAGNQIRQDLFNAMFTRFGGGEAQPEDKVVIHVGSDISAELLVLRVSAVDRDVAYVPPSRLGQIDELKGNKWLG